MALGCTLKQKEAFTDDQQLIFLLHSRSRYFGNKVFFVGERPRGGVGVYEKQFCGKFREIGQGCSDQCKKSEIVSQSMH